MHQYKDLKVWSRAIDLSVEIYKITNEFPTDERFGLISQMRRCAVSIPSNIAEGSGRRSDKEFLQFLGYTRGSICELETQLLVSLKLGYISKENFSILTEELIEIQKIIYTLIIKFENK